MTIKVKVEESISMMFGKKIMKKITSKKKGSD
jgi:hypothetical protein